MDKGYIQGYGEFNLYNMYRNEIEKAFKLNKFDKPEIIAKKLGISDKTLYRYLDVFNLRRLIESNKQTRKLRKRKRCEKCVMELK